MAITVRAARTEDYAAFAGLFPELGVDDPLPSKARFETEMAQRVLFAWEDDSAVAYVFFELLDGIAYVRHLVTAPAARRRGIGRSLLLEVAARARAAGAQAWTLNTEPTNVPALALYEGLGMTRGKTLHALKIPWAAALAASSPVPDLGVSHLPEADDVSIEAALDLVPGQLGAARALPGRVLLVARRGDRLEGLACFDTGFPGAFPFRATHADVAFALLAAMHAHKRAEDEVVNLVAEGQPWLAEAVLAAGGTLRLEVVNLRGPLPA